MTHNAKTIDNFKKGLVGSGFISDTYDLNEKGKIPEDWWKYAVASRYPVDGIKRVEYATEKPYPLIERIVLASSNSNDIVADFLEVVEFYQLPPILITVGSFIVTSASTAYKPFATAS